MTQIGNTLFINIYWLLPQDYILKGIEELDQIREEVSKVMSEDYPDLMIDIIFTKESKWAEDIILREKSQEA